jgi:hypothetical protein
MFSRSLLSPLRAFQQRVDAFEKRLIRPASILSFLVIRFVLMSAMVVGSSWYFLKHSP